MTSNAQLMMEVLGAVEERDDVLFWPLAGTPLSFAWAAPLVARVYLGSASALVTAVQASSPA